MPTSRKIWISAIYCVIFLGFFFIVFAFPVFAQVVINELLPNPTEGQDWVELYNTTNQDINLNDWVLDDEGTKTNMFEIKEATVSAHGFLVFEVGSRLNKNDDTIYLINNQGLTVDEYQYTTNPGTGISLGRMPDGEDWGTCSQPTPEAENQCVVPTPTPSPEPTDTPTPTPTPQLPTPTLTPPPTSSPTPTPVKKSTSTPSPGLILGEEGESTISFYPWEATEEGEESREATPSKGKILPLFFLGFGLSFLAAAGFWLWYTKLR